MWLVARRPMRDAVVVSAVRTATGKAPSGTLRHTRPDEMAATVLDAAIRRTPGVDVVRAQLEEQPRLQRKLERLLRLLGRS